MNDPGFPPSHMELSEAFQRTLKALVGDVPLDAGEAAGDEIRKASNGVETLMRKALATGELRPQVYDRRLDKFFDLPDRRKWKKTPDKMLFGLSCYPCSLTNPGPDTGGLPYLLQCGDSRLG